MDLKKYLQETKVTEIMKKNVVTIFEYDDMSDAEEKFIHNKISHLIVVDHDNKFLGLVSQKYIYKTQSPRKIIKEEMDYDKNIVIDGDTFYEKDTLNKYILRTVMHKAPVVLTPDASIMEALMQIEKKMISCIPIVDKDRKVVGVLTDRDLVSLFSRLINK
jgi:acetoin utilization protein AcuB